MTRAEKTRRLPAVALGALLALVVAAALPPSTAAPAVGHSPVAVGSGHVTDALLAVGHPRPVTQLPASLPAARPSSSERPTPPTAATTLPSLRTAAATPPTAIRGPPA